MTTERENKSCQLLSAKELAKMLSLSKRQIHRLNSCHRLPAPIRIGGSIRWDLERDIKPWLAAGAPDRKAWVAMKQARGE